MSTKAKEIEIDIYPDEITVYGRGQELVKWISDEWAEGTGLAGVIATAIVYAYENGIDAFAETVGKRWDNELEDWVLTGAYPKFGE